MCAIKIFLEKLPKEVMEAVEHNLKEALTEKDYSFIRGNAMCSVKGLFHLRPDIAQEIDDAIPETYEAFRKIHSSG